MGLRKGTPGKGAHGRADAFRYTPVVGGLKGSFGAWIAGEPYWALSHEHTDATPGTKPCLDWMTEGQLRCPRCRPHTVATWIGWVPLYREQDHKPIVVVVHESAMDLLAGLGYPAHVVVGRVDQTSSVFVRKSDNAVSFKTDNEQRKRSRDITGDLLTMWGLRELEEWLLDQRRGVQAAPLRSDGAPFGPMTAAAAQKYTPPPAEHGPSEEAFDEVTNRVKKNFAKLKPSKNGKPET